MNKSKGLGHKLTCQFDKLCKKNGNFFSDKNSLLLQNDETSTNLREDMNVQLCTSPVQICTSNRTEYIVVDPSNLNLTFQEVGFGISRVFDHPKGSCENQITRLMDPSDNRMIYVDDIIKKYVASAKVISQHLGLTICGEGTKYLQNFKWTIEGLQLENLDLSCKDPKKSAELKCLPFIECFRALKRLNLSGNSELRTLPPQLSLMPDLREIDLRNTPIRSLSDGLKGMKQRGVVIFYDNVKAKKEDRAQNVW